MSLERLIRGNGRRTADGRIDYCPACQEDCEFPEISTDASGRDAVSNCPTCGERTVSRSIEAHEVRVQASPAESAQRRDESTSDRVQRISEQRAAVRDRVAREVLAFVAAIERGEVPTDAVGLPQPPGASFLDGPSVFDGLPDLRGRVLLGAGGGDSRAAPASDEAVKNLPRLKVEGNSCILYQTRLNFANVFDEPVEALFASFSTPPSENVFGTVVLADPVTGHTELNNADDVKGNIVVMERGDCTFASKALRAEAAGASGVVIIQTHDVWPYVMGDSQGEAKTGKGLGIPVCMVNKAKGAAIKDALKNQAGTEIQAELSVSFADKDCVVCQELFAEGATLVSLPCEHLYHESCLIRWLKLSNTCPYCRAELPVSDANMGREGRRRNEAGREEIYASLVS